MTIVSKESFEIPSFLKAPRPQEAKSGIGGAFPLLLRARKSKAPLLQPGEAAAPTPSIVLRRPTFFRKTVRVLGLLLTAPLIAIAGMILFNVEFAGSSSNGGSDAPSRFLAAALSLTPATDASGANVPGQTSPKDWSNSAASLQPRNDAPPAPANPEPAPQAVEMAAATSVTAEPPVSDTVAATAIVAATPATTPAAAPAAPAGIVEADSTTAPLPAGADAAVHGVTDREIRFGMASPFTGANKEAGRQLKLGVEAAFNEINDAGGVNGRMLKLFAADDGYEPARTPAAMQELYDKDQVFGFIGNFGTATAAVSVPYALQQRALFLGALSGGNLLRRDPPDRYVFNYRPSYSEETGAAVRYLVKVRRIKPKEIAVFTQQDPFGDAGYDGVAKAMRALPGEPDTVMRLNYKRNTIDVDDAVNQLRATRGRIKAVVMVATYRAAAKFIEKTRDLYPGLIYTNVSAVGATSLADELMLLGPRFGNGVVVTQVAPAVDSSASFVLRYKATLAKYFPGEAPDYTSLESYIDANILIEALKRAGRHFDNEKLIDTMESMHELDLGIGSVLRFSANEHQGSHKVWGTQLDESGHYQPIDLE